ncbi:hypothetical protein COUCH_01850 [Couchioplanes caeruleus]|uniref:hypothetical protein n=1 Tax=Couchioplanes caeruleus TaxID=56438 RepID=UPI0020BECF96|nr:hypothetical protein [Couchioplanes caeruleus]UQU65123.1 hypothetical protein COUCH_01850 [Couchioplanes caeruleus]
MTNPTPAKKTTAAKKAGPAKKAAPEATGPTSAKATPAKVTPAGATPAKKATPAGNAAAPAKKATPAKKAAPLKHTLKAAAAEVAPALVEPDMTTVPDEQTTPAEQPTAASRELATAASRELATATPPASDAPTSASTANASVESSAPTPSAPAQSHPVESATHTEAWARLIADPGHSPELLALAAVQTLGPQAQEWADRMRDAYPGATPDGLARLAAQQFVRFGTVGSVFGAVAGSYAPLTLLGAAALAHAELSLHVAAAYGVDPADPARAADLLLLTRVHPTREDAEAALTAAREHSYEGGGGVTDALWRLGRMVAVHAGAWTVLRGLNRFFPGASLLTAVLTSRAAASTVAARATLFYRTAAAA